MQSYTIMYVLLCSLHSICRFSFNYSIKVIVVLTTFSIISIPYLLNSVLQPYFMPIYSIILLYLFICNMSHVLEINYLILSYLITWRGARNILHGVTVQNYIPVNSYIMCSNIDINHLSEAFNTYNE